MTGIGFAVVECLGRLGTASPREIQDALGNKNAALVRQALSRLVDKFAVERLGRAKYRLKQGFEGRVTPVSMQTERLIESFIESEGGVAATADIHRVLWGKPGDQQDRPYQYRHVCETLRSSSRFSQNFGRGYWNLGSAQLERLPLPGRWQAYLLEQRRASDVPAYGSTCDDLFRTVGEAFADARDLVDVETVTGSGQIGDMLDLMACKANNALSHASACARQEFNHRGSNLRLGVRIGSEELQQSIRNHLYLLFEEGHRALHMAAPARLYRDCAALFGADAAALSRGGLIPSQGQVL